LIGWPDDSHQMGLQKLLRSAASAGTLAALSLATSDIGKLQKVEIIHVVVNSLIFRSTMRLLGNTSYAAIGPQIPMIPFVGLDYPTIEECSLMRSIEHPELLFSSGASLSMGNHSIRASRSTAGTNSAPLQNAGNDGR